MKNSPLILLVNDDGVFSPGLRFLIKICKKIGRVSVVAPAKDQSGRSHAITVDEKIHYKKIESNDMYSEYSCSGTHVDCVKLAGDKAVRWWKRLSPCFNNPNWDEKLKNFVRVLPIAYNQILH